MASSLRRNPFIGKPMGSFFALGGVTPTGTLLFTFSFSKPYQKLVPK
jgi:hypothetical protein